jgi:hypothetical protein
VGAAPKPKEERAMPINSPSATRGPKNHLVASAIEYGLIAILAAAAMTAGFNVLLGASL